MPGLNIFTSNKLEILAEHLAQLVKTPVSSAFDAEMIVVQSTGMQRWVSLALAKHNGICANVQFPFPNSFLEKIARQVLPDFPELSPFDPDVLMFKIMKKLPDCIRQKEFKHLKSYLADDATHLKRLQLSSKLADLYDQYQVFRPEMIRRWEQGTQGTKEGHPAEKWQAHLWRQLANDEKNYHRARLQRALINKITADSHQIMNLPQRIFVFGISYLPLFHMQALVALSQLVDINLFLLNPCREYWSDIFSERQMQRIRKKYPPSAGTATELHLEEGNRLLASMGAHGKDFFTMISDFDIQIRELYQDPGCTNLLSCIQSDILNLRERKAAADSIENQSESSSEPETLPAISIDSSDTSIQIHCCHSPMREIEVLRDNLLAMFDEDPYLKPKDIVVMTPDIDVYAPYIQAVFEAKTDERLRIPFSMADQNARSQNALIEGFLSMLDLKGSRVSAARVMRLLESPGVKDKFGLDRTDIATVERWIRDTRIRWGVDGASRQKLGLPAVSENTWQAGIHRLLLGYAMPGKNQRIFEGILPYDKVEGNEIQSFGKFLEFTDRVFNCVTDLNRPKQLKQWGTALKQLLDDFFQPDEEAEREHQHLRKIIDDLSRRQAEIGFDEKLEFEPIRFYLEQRLDKQSFKSGFMTGGVTFCAMLPMRSIPFKVVCLVGMNSDRFPRKFQPLAFDLIAQHPQPGDRSRRNDDKYLFLESIISARQKLYISYVGQSIQDNSRIPPSVLVSELLDTIEQGFDLPGQDITQHVVNVHRLQAFSSQYFKDDTHLFSYSKENRDAAVCLNKTEDPAPLITSELPLTATEKEELRQLDIETLCRFFSNPAKFLLQQRLGIFLDQTETLTDKREDFELNFLDRYLVGQNLMHSKLEGRNLESYKPVQIARGQLPHAKVGTFHYNEMSIDIEHFVSKIESFKNRKIAENWESQIEINDVRLQVRLPDIYEQGLIHVRYANQRAQDILRSWIYHLAFCEMKLQNQPSTSILIFKNAALQLNPVDHHQKYLAQLLNLFKRGLEKPLHFFPNTSLEYIQEGQIRGKSKTAALKAAQRKWLNSDFARGESDDPYYDICFRQYDPLDDSFQKISETVFKPVFAHYTELEI
jgi:exodeoxyribonuclease V gamma subunit